jgi:hypothetical protein
VDTTEASCTAAGLFTLANDCNDNDPTATEGTWYLDSDGDGVGGDVLDLTCIRPDGFVASTGDCDDADPNVFPGAAEAPADDIDGDCDGREACYADVDGDGVGSDLIVQSGDPDCDDPGESARSNDCDDTDPDIHPDVLETVGDGIDVNCDRQELCFRDADGDGAGGNELVLWYELTCSGGGVAPTSTDCDDTDSTRRPGGPEFCGPVDDNCNGFLDDDDPLLDEAPVWHLDADGDTYGDPGVTLEACEMPDGYVDDARDCDDGTDAWGLSCPFDRAALGDDLLCASRSDGTTVCESSTMSFPVATEFVKIAVRESRFCGIDIDNRLVCFDPTGFAHTPPPAGRFIDVALGEFVACALEEDGHPVCWGLDTGGIVSGSPQGNGFDHLAVGDDRACAWGDNSTPHCWGNGGCGAAAFQPVADMAAWEDTLCFVTLDGTLTCRGCSGDIIYDAPDSTVVTYVDVDIDTGGACAVTETGSVVCWGDRIGLDLTPPPMSVGATTVTVGNDGACVTGVDGNVRCWGSPPPSASFLASP